MPFISDIEYCRFQIAEAKCEVYELTRAKTQLALSIRFRVPSKDDVPRLQAQLDKVQADLSVARAKLADLEADYDSLAAVIRPDQKSKASAT